MLTPATEDAEEFNFGFSDTVVPRVGIEYVFVDTYSLRTGYAFRTSPIGPPQRKANLLDNTTHHFSFGFGVLLPSIRSFSFSADLFSAFDYMPTKAVNKAAKYGKYSYYAFGGFAWNAGLSITAGF